jgi:GNAT superfamily N-acetyltransferase
MPQLLSFLKQDVPREIAIQIRSGVRFVWPQMNPGHAKIWLTAPEDPVQRQTFVMLDDELLVSHVEANLRKLEHIGGSWTVGGLSTVFTYPTHRGQGLGERAAAAASDFLRNGAADFALLFCGERASSMYARHGWELWKKPTITYGDPRQPKIFDDYLVMGMMISERTRDARRTLEGTPLYVGPNTW